MQTAIKSFKRGVWIAYVYDRNANPPNHCVADSLRYQVMLVSGKGHSQWPVRYDNGQIAYEWPDMPRDGQRATSVAYREIDKLLRLNVWMIT